MKTLVMTALFLAFALLNTLSAMAADTPCREEALIRFVADGVDAPSELIGSEDPCDEFGGSLAYSPTHQRHVFVNFNIEGTIDLSEVDAAFALASPSNPGYEWISGVKIAVVTNDWIRKHYQTEKEMFLNMNGTILFLSEKAAKEGRVGAALGEFYGSLR